MNEIDIKGLKTFKKYNHISYYSEHFERVLRYTNNKWILYFHCEVNGDLTFIGIPSDIDDLKYLFEQSGGIWLD